MKQMDEKLLSQVSVIGEMHIIIDCDCAAFFKVNTEEVRRVASEHRNYFGPNDFLSLQDEYTLRSMEKIKRFREMAPEQRPKYGFSGMGFLILATLLHSDEAASITRLLIETYVKVLDLRFVIGEMTYAKLDKLERARCTDESSKLINDLFGDDDPNGTHSITLRVKKFPFEDVKNDKYSEDMERAKDEWNKTKQETRFN